MGWFSKKKSKPGVNEFFDSIESVESTDAGITISLKNGMQYFHFGPIPGPEVDTSWYNKYTGSAITDPIKLLVLNGQKTKLVIKMLEEGKLKYNDQGNIVKVE